MSRRHHVSPDARRNTFYLTPAEELAIDTIKAMRRDRKDNRDSPSEIVSDALWKFAEDNYGIKRQDIESRFPRPEKEEPPRVKVTQMPRVKKKR